MSCEYAPEEFDPPCTDLSTDRLEELRHGVLSKEATSVINDLIKKVQCLCDIVNSTIPDQTDFQLYEGYLDVYSHMGISGDYSATGLPPGLSIDPETGDISGTIDSEPGDVTGSYTPTITVIDDQTGQPYSQTFNWVTLFTTTPPPPKPEVGACCYLRLRDNLVFCRDITQEQCTAKENDSSYDVLKWKGFPVKCSDLGGDANCATTQIGSCCLEDGSCVDNITESKCSELNPGNFSPIWTKDGNCVQANCPDPKGACCLDTGICEDLLPEQCEALNGTFLQGENCSSATFQGCGPHIGVCCLLTLVDNTSECVENVTLESCESMGVAGIKESNWEAQVDCTTTTLYCKTVLGSCCINDNGTISCQEGLTQLECSNIPNAYDWDSGVDCASSIKCNPKGSCCVRKLGSNECHDNVTKEECEEIENNTLGATSSAWEPFSNCLDTTLNCNTTEGSCCIDDNGTLSCHEGLTYYACRILTRDTVGGTPEDNFEWEANTDCATTSLNCNTTTGTCCEDDNGTLSCTDGLTEYECLSQASQFGNETYTWEANTTCNTTTLNCNTTILGVCCINDGTLGSCTENISEFDCLSLAVGNTTTEWEAGSDCNTTTLNCSFNIGTCCIDVGGGLVTCIDNITELQCEIEANNSLAVASNWEEGTDCATTTLNCNTTQGACCINDNGTFSCTDGITASECSALAATLGGLVSHQFEAGTDCQTTSLVCTTEVVGACCIGGMCDSVTTLENCNNIGGTWAGPGSSCVPGLACAPGVGEPGGACCVANDGCFDNVTEAVCNLVQGTWVSEGSTCANEIGNGDCIAQTPGVRTSCCLPGGACIDDMLVLTCLTIGGDPSTVGVSCQDANCTG